MAAKLGLSLYGKNIYTASVSEQGTGEENI
jgi:hypothetical protein